MKKMTKRKEIQDCYDSCSADEDEMKEQRSRSYKLNGRVSREHTLKRMRENAKRWRAKKSNMSDA